MHCRSGSQRPCSKPAKYHPAPQLSRIYPIGHIDIMALGVFARRMPECSIAVLPEGDKERISPKGISIHLGKNNVLEIFSGSTDITERR